MKKIYPYLRADLKRAACSRKIALSIVLTTGVLLLATHEGIALNTDVLYVFSLVMYGMPSMLILVCGATAFADSLCEDMQKKYILQQSIRGDMKSYVSARVISIFIASVLSSALGIFLFACILHIGLPWADTDGAQYDIMVHAGRLSFILRCRWFPLYYFSYGVQYGILVGILAVWASFFSIYISNQMLVLSTPMIIYYFADYALTKISSGLLNLSIIFSPASKFFENDVLSVLFIALIASANLILIRCFMIKGLRRKFYE